MFVQFMGCPVDLVEIFNIKDVVLIFQKDPFLRRERIQSYSSGFGRIHNFHGIMLCFGEIHI